jgi:hypothetical protein
MNCTECREQIIACLEDALPAQDAQEVTAHLEACATCRLEAAEQHRLRDRLIADARALSQPPLDTRVMDRIHRAETFKLRRNRMRKRYGLAALAVAASVVLAISVGLWPESGHKGSSGRVYALSDVPGLLASARTLHYHEYSFVPSSDGYDAPIGTAHRRIEKDIWLDLANSRWHIADTDQGLTDGLPPSDELKRECTHRFMQWISDGEYALELVYDQPVFRDDPSTRKIAQFTRLNALHRQLRLRHYYMWATEWEQELSDAEVLSHFAQVGRETINGVSFSIWEAVQDLGHRDRATGQKVYDETHRLKFRIWFSPALGIIQRVERWQQYQPNGQWVNTEVVDKVERDVAPPPGIFDPVPPPGYTLENTKDTARYESIADDCSGNSVGDLTVQYHIGLNLSDGSILLGWSSRDPKDPASQAPLFEGLSPGGPLPKLPIEIQAIRSDDPGCDLTYAGRHLAWTQKGDRFFEWSVFVPNRDRAGPFACLRRIKLEHAINSANATAAQDKELHISSDWFLSHTAIKNREEFNTLVLGAMAELSDSGTAPEGITYEYVTQLSRQIRESLGKP